MKAADILTGAAVLLSSQVALAQGSADSRLERAIEEAIDAAVESEARRPRPKLPRGSILLRVKDADLKTHVLPVFLEQVGVRILYEGSPRKLTLKLNAPIGWEEGLDLVAQFTNTHITEDRHGNLVLKNAWGGKVEEEGKPEKKGTRPPHIGPAPKRGGLRYTGKRAPQSRVRPRRVPRYNPKKYRPPKQRVPKQRVPKRVSKQRVPKHNPKYRPPKQRVPKYNPKYRPPKYRPPKYRPKQYKPPKYNPR